MHKVEFPKFQPQKELMDYLECLFGVDTFNKSGVTSAASTYLKYVWNMYKVDLKKNPRYENPPMILEREWKALIEDAKEKKREKKEKYHLVHLGKLHFEFNTFNFL